MVGAASRSCKSGLLEPSWLLLAHTFAALDLVWTRPQSNPSGRSGPAAPPRVSSPSPHERQPQPRPVDVRVPTGRPPSESGRAAPPV